MNEAVTYEWSEELGRKAFRAYRKATVGRPWLFGFVGLIFLATSLPAFIVTREPGHLLGIALGVLLLARFSWERVMCRRFVRDAARLLEESTIKVALDDNSVTISRAGQTTTVKWSQLTRIREVDGFLLFFVGRILCACLPTEAFSDRQVDFIKSAVSRPN